MQKTKRLPFLYPADACRERVILPITDIMKYNIAKRSITRVHRKVKFLDKTIHPQGII